MKKACELCKGMARMHCDSDQASLCWDCDAKVHSANFLVARHSRNLLCHVCQSPTPWSASGAKLVPTVSVCEECFIERRFDREAEEDEDEQEQEEMEENQVVPWSPPESTSSDEESVSRGGGDAVVARKRCWLQDASSDEGLCCSSSQLNLHTPPAAAAEEEEAAIVTDSLSSIHLRKIRRKELGRVGVSGSGILESLRRLHREETGSGAEMAEFCTLSNGPQSR